MTCAPRLTLVCVALGWSLSPDASAQARVDASVWRRLADVPGPVAVWIDLADKGAAERDLARALDRVAAGYGERARARRALRRGAPDLFDARDLPVDEGYVRRIEAEGARIRTRSSWLNAVSADVPREALDAIAALPCVRRIEPVHRGDVETTTARIAAAAGLTFYGAAQEQLDSIRLPALHARGFTGAGVVIAVLDTGFKLTHTAFNHPTHPLQVVAAWDFVDNDPEVGPEPGDDPQQHEHGTIVLGALAAYQPNFLVGAAYDASYVLAKVERVNSETQVEEDYFVAGVQFAEASGADVITSSVGFSQWYTQAQLNGRTARATVAINVASANGVHCITAAGNHGHDLDPRTSRLIAPADAFDVISCGAVSQVLAASAFSSDGPTADGRVKPEVMAQGEAVWSVSPTDDETLASRDGTSMAAPLVAGAVACLTQERPAEAVATLRERLLKTADGQGSPRPDPLYVYGYGVVDAAAAAALAGTWSDLGGAIAGSAGTPRLGGTGPLVGVEPIALALTSARPFAPLALIIGTSPLQLPLFGGTLVPLPSLSIAAATNAAGGLTATTRWVRGLPTGFSLYTQAWILDPTTPFGIAASNGLRARSP